MNIITEPKVHLLAVPKFIPHPIYKLPISTDLSDAALLCSFAAKGCYNSFGEEGRSVRDNQKEILNHRHGSVLEHAHFSFWIEGVSRGLTLELNRHRTFNISQRSTRYVQEDDSGIVLDPSEADIWNKCDFQYDSATGVFSFKPTKEYPPAICQNLCETIKSFSDALTRYKESVDAWIEWAKINRSDLKKKDLRKFARGKAKNVLPQSLETRGVWTTNIRGIRWILEARTSDQAEEEISRLAGKIYDVMLAYEPLYFEDYVATPYHNTRILTTPYSKV